jgi:tetratricopeptide (TPR) repeat protein
MSVTNMDITSNHRRETTDDCFTFFQAVLLIILALAVSIGGWYAAGKYYFWKDLDMKRISQQVDFLKKKVETEPKNLKHRIDLGYTYYLLGDYDLAIKELNQALEIDDKHYGPYYNLGLVYVQQGRLNDAMEMFQKAIEIAPRDYKAHMQKGIVYRELKMYKEALESLGKADKLMPRSANIIYEIGRVAEVKGDTERARSIYKEALSYDPLFKDAVKALENLEKK